MLDTVTGLRDSRALWRELAQRAASCCASSPLAVLVFDFDRFGELNERYNPTVGDAVLRRCAEVAAIETPSDRLAFAIAMTSWWCWCPATRRTPARSPSGSGNG